MPSHPDYHLQPIKSSKSKMKVHRKRSPPKKFTKKVHCNRSPSNRPDIITLIFYAFHIHATHIKIYASISAYCGDISSLSRLYIGRLVKIWVGFEGCCVDLLV